LVVKKSVPSESAVRELDHAEPGRVQAALEEFYKYRS